MDEKWSDVWTYVLYREGTGNKLLAKLFAFFGVAVALLGIGTFGQVKSIADAVTISFNIPLGITAAIITVLVAAVTLEEFKEYQSG